MEEQGVGLSVRDFGAEISPAVDRLLAPDNFRRLRQRAAAIRNRAVFEITEMLDGILAARTQPESVLAG